jgi:protein dithiol oxidoreductase (disulfide-forming)
VKPLATLFPLTLAIVANSCAQHPARPAGHWQPGFHYGLLIPPLELDEKSGKAEVIELFMYTSPGSRDLQPFLEKWLARKPENVAFRRQPAIIWPHAREQARLYFTLEKLGRTDLHQQFFEWVWDESHYPTYFSADHQHPDRQAMFALSAEFARVHAIDAETFRATYHSKEIDDRVLRAETMTHFYQVNGTSTFVIDGRYSTSVRRIGYMDQKLKGDEQVKELLRLVDALVASGRTPPRKHNVTDLLQPASRSITFQNALLDAPSEKSIVGVRRAAPR